MINNILMVAIATAAFAGCGASANQLVKRASFDMSCPEDQIQVVEIDKRTRGVRGCGKQATYVENCPCPRGAYSGPNCACTWILNSESK